MTDRTKEEMSVWTYLACGVVGTLVGNWLRSVLYG